MYGSNPGGGGVHFHHKWNMGMTKDRSRAEGGLEFFKGVKGLPGRGLGFSSEHRRQWGSM